MAPAGFTATGATGACPAPTVPTELRLEVRDTTSGTTDSMTIVVRTS
jgi:hypothetical protein